MQTRSTTENQIPMVSDKAANLRLAMKERLAAKAKKEGDRIRLEKKREEKRVKKEKLVLEK